MNLNKVELPNDLIDANELFEMPSDQLRFYAWKIKHTKEV